MARVAEDRACVNIRVRRDLYEFMQAAAESEERTVANWSQRTFAAEVERLMRAKTPATRHPEQRSA